MAGTFGSHLSGSKSAIASDSAASGTGANGVRRARASRRPAALSLRATSAMSSSEPLASSTACTGLSSTIDRSSAWAESGNGRAAPSEPASTASDGPYRALACSIRIASAPACPRRRTSRTTWGSRPRSPSRNSPIVTSRRRRDSGSASDAGASGAGFVSRGAQATIADAAESWARSMTRPCRLSCAGFTTTSVATSAKAGSSTARRSSVKPSWSDPRTPVACRVGTAQVPAQKSARSPGAVVPSQTARSPRAATTAAAGTRTTTIDVSHGGRRRGVEGGRAAGGGGMSAMKLERDRDREVHAHLALPRAVGDVDRKRSGRRAIAHSHADADRRIERAPVVGGITDIDEGRHPEVAVEAVSPLDVLGRCHGERATADRGGALLHAEALEAVAADGRRAARPEQEIRRHGRDAVRLHVSEVGARDDDVPFADRKELLDAAVAAQECVVELRAARAHGAFQAEDVAAARIDQVVHVAPHPAVRRGQDAQALPVGGWRAAVLVLEVARPAGHDVVADPGAHRAGSRRAKAPAPHVQVLDVGVLGQ